MSITAIVENDTIKLPPGVHVPNGTQVEITLPDDGAQRPTVAERYAKLTGLAEDMPSDLARNLDHYVHGHARKP